MDKVVCRVIQYLAMKLNYVKKCRSYAEYERWQKEETDGMWPMVLGQAWLAPVYSMLPHEEQLKGELDRATRRAVSKPIPTTLWAALGTRC